MSVFRAIFNVALIASTAIVVIIGIAVAADAPVKIIDIGDSYIIGNGLVTAEAFPTTLQAALKSRGHLVELIDTGYKNTSASGLAWLLEPAGQKLLDAPVGHGVILELGGNDCSLFDVEKTRSNLEQIVSQLAKKHIPVLLVGTECLIPDFDGAIFSLEWRDALWARFFTAAPQRLRQSVEQYSIVKRA
jgi:acyl-CoA thioesterase-1